MLPDVGRVEACIQDKMGQLSLLKYCEVVQRDRPTEAFYEMVLIFAAVAEAATGLALLIVPSLVGHLLLGEELTGVAIPVARVAGVAVIALGIACWPGPPLVGMLTYSALVTLYLAYLGFASGLTGVFLWPAVALHVVLSILLGRAWLATKTS